MRAIYINAEEQTITEIETDGSLESMYELLKCDCIDRVVLGRSIQAIDLWIDDEGLLKNPEYGFVLKGRADSSLTIAGNGLILNSNNFGDCVATSVSLKHLRSMIEFKTFDMLNPAPRPTIAFTAR